MGKPLHFMTKQDEIDYILENSLSLERDLERLGELMNDDKA